MLYILHRPWKRPYIFALRNLKRHKKSLRFKDIFMNLTQNSKNETFYGFFLRRSFLILLSESGKKLWIKKIIKDILLSMAKGFYLHHVDYGVYTSFGYCTNLQPISKSFLAIKYINKPFLHAKFQTDWFKTVENTSDPKSISDSGVWCNER